MTDVNALNRDFSRYDQVEKTHTYRLAEHQGDAFDEDYKIAVLDFGQFLNGDAAERDSFVATWPEWLSRWSFTPLSTSIFPGSE